MEPPTLLEYVKDKEAAILLGKALFWDMQVGSDGMVACASCHFHAGADNRSKNQLSPGLNDLGRKKTGDPRFGNAKGARGYSEFGPNYQLELADFPLHKRTNPDLQLSRTTRDTNDVVASQGVVLKQFAGINPAGAEDAGVTLDDPIFQLKLKNSRQNARQVEPLNAPSVVNAVFNFANFWKWFFTSLLFIFFFTNLSAWINRILCFSWGWFITFATTLEITKRFFCF